jgi:hypothetical protein
MPEAVQLVVPEAVPVCLTPSVVYHTGFNGVHVRNVDLNCDFAGSLGNAVSIPYDQLPHWPASALFPVRWSAVASRQIPCLRRTSVALKVRYRPI